MSDKKVFKRFIESGKFSEEKINKLKEHLSISDNRLIRDTFSLLNEEIGYLDETQDYIYIIENCVRLLNIICNDQDFSEEQIKVNRKRIKGSREALLAYSHKLKNDDLLNAANKLDEISLDKGIKGEDLVKLIKRLLERKEDFNIIKKILNTNKSVLTYKKNELFDYAFYKALESLKQGTPDIYYYISLLKIFYSSIIDKTKYLKDLNECSDETNEFANEIYYLLYGQKRSLSTDEIIDKYGIITNFQSTNIFTPTDYTNNDEFILSIDSVGTLVRDDAISIKKDGNNYIIGIHITDPSVDVYENNILDYQARNNFECIYLPDRTTKIFPDSFEKDFSLDKYKVRKVISMYIVINNNGVIQDYKIMPNVVKINENLSFDECDLMLNYYCNDTALRIKEFYEVSSILEEINKHKYIYWSQKENDSLDKIVIRHESDKIINELMVLYNHLCAKTACNECIPYTYRTQKPSYIGNLAKKLNIQIDEETQKIINNIYLRSQYSYLPIYHNGLHLDVYSQSSSPLRKYPDCYNQLLMHGLYFKDIDFKFDEDYHRALIEYFNQRKIEMSLFASEYSRALKLKKN